MMSRRQMENEMTSAWPCLVWLGITLIGTGLRWGSGKIEFSDIAATAVIATILYYGNFFEPLSRLFQ